MPLKLDEVFAAADAGDFEQMEAAIQKVKTDSDMRQAAREMGLSHAVVSGHKAATALLKATASGGNLSLAYWNMAEAHLLKKYGLKVDLVRVEAHLKKAAPFIRKMNGGKLMVSNAVKRHIKNAKAVALYDAIFGVAMSRFVRKGG
jgi:predicted TIM-barrel fold metal-dependent hydrolase